MPFVLAGLALAFFTMLLFGGTELDRGLLMLLHADRPPLIEVAGLLTAALAPVPLLFVAGLGLGPLLVRRDWPRGSLLLAAALGAQLLTLFLTGVTADLRPAPADLIYPTQQRAFPDPHAANAAATGLALAFLLVHRAPWRGLALFAAALAALAAGTGRILLGAAWPSDVIAGWALGLFWPLLLLSVAGEDLGDGTPRPVRHSPAEGDRHGRESPDRDGPPDR